MKKIYQSSQIILEENVVKKLAKSFFALLLAVSLGLLQGCKEKDNTPENPYLTPVNVLNSKSEYTVVWNRLSSQDGIVKEFIPLDITLQDGHLLHFATGISSITTYIEYLRATIDLKTAREIENPPGINLYPLDPNVRFDRVVAQFFPYTNIFSIKTENFAGPQNEGFYGDISAEGGFGPKPWGVNDFSFRYPVYNSGGGDGHFSSITSIAPQLGSKFKMIKAGIGNNFDLNYYRFSCIHEVYNDNGIPKYFAIGCTKDSVKVYRIDFTSMGSSTEYPRYTQTLINAITTDLPYTYSSVDNPTAWRHYSNDGKKLSFMVSDVNTGEENKTRSTYIYNFETNSLVQVLDKVKLEFAGLGSDIDIDENGFIYYTGDANFGKNTAGVSVYKKTSAGNTLVGADNFLKFGTVKKLKYLDGKIYMAITGRKTGTDIKQVTLLKQN